MNPVSLQALQPDPLQYGQTKSGDAILSISSIASKCVIMACLSKKGVSTLTEAKDKWPNIVRS